ERLGAVGKGERWRVRVALVLHDPGQTAALVEEIEHLGPDDLVPVRDVLLPFGDAVRERLWARARTGSGTPGTRLRAAVLLAAIAPKDEQWADIAPGVARAVVRQARLHLRTFV